jgi:hypothetical protein
MVHDVKTTPHYHLELDRLRLAIYLYTPSRKYYLLKDPNSLKPRVTIEGKDALLFKRGRPDYAALGETIEPPECSSDSSFVFLLLRVLAWDIL